MSAKKLHGKSKTAEYHIWSRMRNRCHNPKCNKFRIYGARGIVVCERWRESFDNFLSDMGPRPDGMTLERKDVNGNYEPSNCIWADNETQQNNRRDNIQITHDGKTMTAIQWVRHLGLHRKRLDKNMRAKHSIERLLDPTPLRKRRRL